MTLSPEYAALCERLEHEVVIAEHEHPAFTIVLPDGSEQECGPSISQTVTRHNPDGPEAAAAIRAQAAQIASLEEEMNNLEVEQCAADDEAAREVVKIAAQAARIEALEGALMPFAKVGNIPAELRHRNITITDDRIVSVEMPFAPHERVRDEKGGTPVGLCISLDGLTVGDFRRAHQALGDRS